MLLTSPKSPLLKCFTPFSANEQPPILLLFNFQKINTLVLGAKLSENRLSGSLVSYKTLEINVNFWKIRVFIFEMGIRM